MPENFQPTRWSLVLQARSPRDDSRIEALNQLAEAYWKPLYWFARRSGLSPDDAADLIQDFFAKLLERDWLDRADPNRGRLRSFLLILLKRHLSDQRKHDRAEKRGGGVAALSIDVEVGEQLLAATGDDPAATLESEFDRHWARTVFAHSLETLRQECEAKGKAELFAKLEPFLAGNPDADRADLSDGAVRVALHRLRERLRGILRDEVQQTLLPEDDLGAELRYLGSLL